MSNWTSAILPLLGVILGAVLHSWFARVAQQKKQIGDFRAQAYSDFLRAVAASSHLRSDEDLRDSHRDAADAKARIAVYGTSDVIRSLARFEQAGAVLSDDASTIAFVSMVSSMRPKGEFVSERDLKLLLFGTEITNPDGNHA